MAGFLLFVGIIWLVYNFIKEASIKPMHPDTDIRQAYIDSVTGKVSKKELNKRLSNGYYAKKK